MSSKNKNSPRAGPAFGRESRPVGEITDGLLHGYGGSSKTCHRETQPIVHQAGTSKKTTEKNQTILSTEEEHIIAEYNKRRNKCARSPEAKHGQGQTTLEQRDISSSPEEFQRNKRRRTENDGEEKLGKNKQEKTWNRVVAGAESLTKLINQNQNTKKEIKEAAKVLATAIRKVSRDLWSEEGLNAVEEGLNAVEEEKERINLIKTGLKLQKEELKIKEEDLAKERKKIEIGQNVKLELEKMMEEFKKDRDAFDQQKKKMIHEENTMSYLHSLEKELAETKQTNAKLSTEMKLLKESLNRMEKNQRGDNKKVLVNMEQIKNFEEWHKQRKCEIEEELCTNTEIKTGNPLLTKDSTLKVVFIEPDDPSMQRSIQKMYKERFPELMAINENFGVLEQFTKVQNKGEGGVRTVIKITHDNLESNLWESLCKIKTDFQNHESIALHTIGFMPKVVLRNMVEAIFHGTDTFVSIYTNRSTTDIPKVNPVTKERNTYALVIRNRDKNYADTLKKVKNAIQGNDATNSIKALRSTKEGDLLVTIEKDEEILSELHNIIERKLGPGQIRKYGCNKKKQVSIIIRGMEATTEENDIKMALEQRISNKDIQYKIGKMRQGARDTQTVTITIDEDASQTILNRKSIRIGMVECSAEKRITVPRCYKCWSYDHSVKNCDGPDRSKACFNCGEDGHDAKN